MPHKKHMIYMRHKKRIVAHLRPLNIYAWKKYIYIGSICIAIGQTEVRQTDRRTVTVLDVARRRAYVTVKM